MSYRPTTSGMSGSASYSEFLKDIYTSLRTLTTGLAAINIRLDNISTQLQNFETRLTSQDQRAEFLATRIDTLIQQSQTTQIRQTTSGLSILNELDTLGLQQVEPNTTINDTAARLQTRPQIAANRLLFTIPEINITEDVQDTLDQQNSLMGLYNKNKTNQSSVSCNAVSHDLEQHQESEQNQEQYQSTNFLILD